MPSNNKILHQTYRNIAKKLTFRPLLPLMVLSTLLFFDVVQNRNGLSDVPSPRESNQRFSVPEMSLHQGIIWHFYVHN